jgi:hypothetical protein
MEETERIGRAKLAIDPLSPRIPPIGFTQHSCGWTTGTIAGQSAKRMNNVNEVHVPQTPRAQIRVHRANDWAAGTLRRRIRP